MQLGGNTPAGFAEVTSPFNGGIIFGVTTDATGARTLSIPDIYANYIRLTHAVANVVTVPPNSVVAFPIGTQISFRRATAGTATIVAGSGVTINASAFTARDQHSTITLIKIATDVWDLFGDLT